MLYDSNVLTNSTIQNLYSKIKLKNFFTKKFKLHISMYIKTGKKSSY